jgi:hypothetical protein
VVKILERTQNAAQLKVVAAVARPLGGQRAQTLGIAESRGTRRLAGVVIQESSQALVAMDLYRDSTDASGSFVGGEGFDPNGFVESAYDARNETIGGTLAKIDLSASWRR